MPEPPALVVKNGVNAASAAAGRQARTVVDDADRHGLALLGGR